MRESKAKPMWVRILEAFARGSVHVGLFLGIVLGILGMAAIQGFDILHWLLGSENRGAWLVTGAIAALVSSALALQILRKERATRPGAEGRGPQS